MKMNASFVVYVKYSIPNNERQLLRFSVFPDSTSAWTLTADTYITAFEGSMENVVTGGYTLYVDGAAMN